MKRPSSDSVEIRLYRCLLLLTDFMPHDRATRSITSWFLCNSMGNHVYNAAMIGRVKILEQKDVFLQSRFSFGVICHIIDLATTKIHNSYFSKKDQELQIRKCIQRETNGPSIETLSLTYTRRLCELISLFFQDKQIQCSLLNII